MLLEQLSPLLLRHIALHMANPGGLAGAFVAAWRSIKDDAFALEWFSRWHPIITPHRPWQYSIITWRQVSNSEPKAEQLASFMLRCLQWQKERKQRQLEQEVGCRSSSARGPQAQPFHRTLGCTIGTAPAGGAAVHSEQDAAAEGAMLAPPQQQQPQQPGHTSVVARKLLLQRSSPCEGSISSFPGCQPVPATEHKARKLASNGHGVAALLLLCPASSTLLLAYAAKARNVALVQQVLGTKQSAPVFPYCYLNYSKLYPQFPAAELACYVALRAGLSDMLMLFLASKQGACSYLAQPLLQFSAQHSNAACVEQLLLHAAVTNSARLSPTHLAAAAARGDHWAAAVVELLLNQLPLKQRTAKWLKPAYAAACNSGGADVLQVLLCHVAATVDSKRRHLQHVAALLEVCGKSGNAGYWELLLGVQQSHAGSNSSSSGASTPVSTQQQQHEQQQPLPPLATSCLTPQQWLDILHAVLPCSSLQYQNSRPSDEQQDCSNRFRMADQLWGRMQAAGQAAAVQQLVAERPKPDMPLMPSAAAMQLLCLEVTEEGTITISNGMLPERLWWLQMHGLMLTGLIGQYVLRTVWHWVDGAFQAGEYQYALQLYRMWCECDAAHQATEAAMSAPLAATSAPLAATSAPLAATKAFPATVEPDSAICLSEAPAVPEATAKASHEPPAATTGPPVPGDVAPSDSAGAAASQLEAAVLSLDSTAAAVFTGAGSSQSAAAAATATAAAGEPQQPAQEPQSAAAAAAEQPQPELFTAAPPGSARSVTPDQIVQQDMHHAAGMLLSSRFAAAVVVGDLTAIQQIAALAVAAQLPLDSKADVQATRLLPQWLCSKKLLTSHTYHNLHSQLGYSQVSTSRQQQEAGASVVTSSSSTAAAGGNSSKTTLSQQQQQEWHGCLPLWQLALLPLLSGTSTNAMNLPLNGVQQAKALLSKGVGAQQLQVLSVAGLLGNDVPHILSTGILLAEAAIEQMSPSVLAWTLQPGQRYLWAGDSVVRTPAYPWGQFVLLHGTPKCSPIDSRRRTHWYSLEKEEEQQLMQHRQQLSGPPAAAGAAVVVAPQPIPAFLQPSVDLAILMLQQPPPTDCNMLSQWISKSVGAHSSVLLLERVKAILAAVAASSDIPCGAKIVYQAGIRKVLVTGDVDLLAMLLMWAARLPAEPATPAGADGVDVHGGEDLWDAVFGGDMVDAADGNDAPNLEAALGPHNNI